MKRCVTLRWRWLQPIALWAGAIATVGCSSPPDIASSAESRKLGISSVPSVVVDFAARDQRVTGFGTSSAWTTPSLSDEEADFFFSEERGLGISLLRLRIAPDGTTGETQTALRAQERGAKIWAAPWSPPGAWKSNGTDNQGGSLLPEYYSAWAKRLAEFVAIKKSQGIDLIALSAQNEPNWTAEWETCIWTPAQLTTFVGAHLGPAVRAVSPETTIMAPESANWSSLMTFAEPLLDDAAARDFVGIIASHAYGGAAFDYSRVRKLNKEFWETEVSYEVNSGIWAALGTARMIHEHLTIGRVNAWHYWWMDSDSDTSLRRNGEVLPQTYGLGHYSKFVRPGFDRVNTQQPDTLKGVRVSAFADFDSSRFAIIAINENETPTPVGFDLGTWPVDDVRPWITTETVHLEPQAVIAGASRVEYTLPPLSITSLVSVPRITIPSGDGGAGGDSAGGAGGAAGAGSDVGGAPDYDSGGESGANAMGGTTASGGTTAVQGGVPAAQGGTSGSGGVTALAGTTADSNGATGNSRGVIPEYPVLPGCYCATAVPKTESNGVGWAGLLATLGLLRRRRVPSIS